MRVIHPPRQSDNRPTDHFVDAGMQTRHESKLQVSEMVYSGRGGAKRGVRILLCDVGMGKPRRLFEDSPAINITAHYIPNRRPACGSEQPSVVSW